MLDFYGEKCLFYIPFLFFFFFVFFFFFFFFFKNSKRAWSGGSRGEQRASEIASERTRARGERDLFS